MQENLKKSEGKVKYAKVICLHFHLKKRGFVGKAQSIVSHLNFDSYSILYLCGYHLFIGIGGVQREFTTKTAFKLSRRLSCVCVETELSVATSL